jgi:hypothetical protein
MIPHHFWCDHQVTHVLETRGQELEEHSRALLATASVLITGPGLVLRARLRPPRWWRRGELETALEDTASHQVTYGRSMITVDSM